MPTASDSKPTAINITVNLPALLGQLQVALQRLSDLVAVGLAGAAKVEENDYREPTSFASLEIASDHRMTLDMARDEFQTWCLKNSFTEAIDLVGVFLEECRTIAAVYRLPGSCSGGEFNKAFVHDKKKFHEQGFPAKIEHLRKQFGVLSKFEEHVLSLNRARNCLVHRLGTVSAKDADASGRLTVTWHSLNLIVVDNTTQRETVLSAPTAIESESTLTARIGPHRRQFAIGDKIQFNQDEHKHTVLTFYVFALEIVQSLERLQPRSRHAGPNQS